MSTSNRWEPIDDTSTVKLMEGVLTAFAQFDNDVRSDRTRARIGAALELGRWTFPAPLGNLNAPTWSKTSLIHDSPRLGTATGPKRKERTSEQEKRVKVIQQKLDRLDEAFLFAQSIDATSYERQRDRLREELTLAQIDHHAEAVDELDVQGILAFAERVFCRGRQTVGPGVAQLQAAAAGAVLSGRDRVRRIRFNRTAVPAPLFNYLAPDRVLKKFW